MVGGGLTGCETALWLGQSGRKDVTLVEAERLILSADEIFTDAALFPKLLGEAGVTVLCDSQAIDADAGGLFCSHADGRSTRLDAGTVVIATGYTPNDELLDALHSQAPALPVSRVGTAEAGSRLMDALHSSFFSARLI